MKKILTLLIILSVILVACAQPAVQPEPVYEDAEAEPAVEPVLAPELPPAEPEPVEAIEAPVEEPADEPLADPTPEPLPESETVQTEDMKDSVSQPIEVGVVIDNLKFQPATLTIKKGTKVTWVNQDGPPHTASGAAFDSGTLNNGQTFSFTFEETGTFDYICNIHPSMTAKVIVE